VDLSITNNLSDEKCEQTGINIVKKKTAKKSKTNSIKEKKEARLSENNTVCTDIKYTEED